MQIYIFKPHISLRPFIRFYWLLEVDEQLNQPQHLMPGVCHDMIIHLGPHPNYKIGDNDWQVRSPVGFIEGLFNSFLLLRFTGVNRLIGIRFESTGLYPFVKTPVHQFTDKFVDLTDVFSHSGTNLIDKLAQNKSDNSLPEILDHFLLRNLHSIESDDQLEFSLQIILQHHGIIQVRQLCEITGCSERQIERKFNRKIGISPERFAQRIRLQHFIKLSYQSNNKSFTYLAQECCYSDQSHLIRSFKQLTGLTPGEYFQQQHPIQQALSQQY